MLSPEISVIIPVYNQGEFLAESMDSLKKQTIQNFETILINDGSTESKTLEILKKLEACPPLKNFKIYHKKNGGLSSARNLGIQKSKGDFFVPLDADDKLHPEFLEQTYKHAKAKNLDFVGTHIQHFGIKNSIHKTRINFYEELFNNQLPVCALFHKKIYQKIQGYDETFKHGYEDWDFWISILKNNFQGKIIPKPFFFYRIKKESMLTVSNTIRPQIITKIRKKHAHLYQKETLKKIKKSSKNIRAMYVLLHKLHFWLSINFPALASLISTIYLKCKNK